MIRGGKAIIFLQIDCKILIFHTAISFFIVGEPIIFGKILGKIFNIFSRILSEISVHPGGITHTPSYPLPPHIHTYIPTPIPIIPLQIDLSQSRVSIFPSDRYKAIGLQNSTRRFLPERTLPEHFLNFFFEPG